VYYACVHQFLCLILSLTFFPPRACRSHVCWHVYGLLHRSDRNYNEAIKAYKQALRIDPENLQILRDLSLLQIQMRDLAGFVVTRHTLLTLKANAKINWLSFALAKHLTGDLRGAISVIDTYLGTLTEEESPELERGFESSELAMYRNTILSEIPDNYGEALEHLAECEGLVVDRGAWLMTKATYQLYLGQFEEARKTFLDMFERGACDDYRVHSGYMCALLELDPKTCEEALNLDGMDTVASTMKLTEEQKQTILEAYRGELLTLMPKSPTVKRIPLTLQEGDEFRTAIDAYCRKALTRGVPSLCSDLSSFLIVEEDERYRRIDDPVDIKSNAAYRTFVEMTDGYITSLDTNGKFSADDDKDETPSTILWAWFLRAGLHELAGEYEEGIALLDKCLEHTPTAVDVYELKARLLKAAGDIKSAVECLDTGRELDKQDRYINNQTTKYMLQAGMQEKALERISLFTRHEGNPEQNLFDMQCSWYELELADSLEKKEEWGRSLKKYCESSVE
jgi:tetratricopeptide (TPR) repeat protein